jgi:hypothetical protein
VREWTHQQLTTHPQLLACGEVQRQQQQQAHTGRLDRTLVAPQVGTSAASSEGAYRTVH